MEKIKKNYDVHIQPFSLPFNANYIFKILIFPLSFFFLFFWDQSSFLFGWTLMLILGWLFIRWEFKNSMYTSLSNQHFFINSIQVHGIVHTYLLWIGVIMEFEKIIPTVVLCLYFASRVSEARILSDEEDLELERQLKLINKPPVKSIQVLD